MRINRFVALASGLGRRQVDKLITEGKIEVDGKSAEIAQSILPGQKVSLNGKLLNLPTQEITLALNKPVGYIVSRLGQGAPTIYSLLPKDYLKLKPIGRLDKDSSGLLLLSNDGQLIFELSHPSFSKQKIYELTLDKPLTDLDQQQIQKGVRVLDYISKLHIKENKGSSLIVSMEEGRNRQIRRTFEALDYKVIKLNRQAFGEYTLGNLKPGEYREVNI